MKIAVVVHDYLPRHGGGTEIHAHQGARELVARGHEVLAIHTERDLDAPEGDLRDGEFEGVRTIELVHQREYADVRESWRQSLPGEALRAILKSERPDVVHFQHLSLWGSRCIQIARERGARVLVTLNDFFLLCDDAVLLDPALELCTAAERGECSACLRRHPLCAERRLEAPAGTSDEALWAQVAAERYAWHKQDLLMADAVVCPSRFLAERFLAAGMLTERQVRVLKYGYPGARRAPQPSDPSQPLRVGYVGGIYPSKGVHVLVEAMAQLAGESLQLSIWGALDWFPSYVDELRAKAAGAAVSFEGEYPPEEVDRVLQSFDVLVVPSIWYENLPLTIQEAYRNGLPVITTDLGGMAESVQHEESGLLFPRGDSGALAAQLRRLAGDRELCLRLAEGRPHVPQLSEVVDVLEELYREERVGAAGR